MIKQPARAIVQEMYSNSDRFVINYAYNLGSMFRKYVYYIEDMNTGLVLVFNENGDCSKNIGLRNKDYRYIRKHALKIEKARKKRYREIWNKVEKEEEEKVRKHWCEIYGVDSE